MSYQPSSFAQFIGNEKAIKLAKTLISSSKTRGGNMRDIGIFGSSGTGKTTLSRIIANELGASFNYYNGSSLIKNEDVFRIINNSIVGKENNDRVVILIDEAHAMEDVCQDTFLSVLSERIVSRKLERFRINTLVTFIFATTHQSLLRETIANRMVHLNMKEYSNEEKAKISERYVKGNNLEITKQASDILGKITNHARDCVSICDTCIDVMSPKHKRTITEGIVKEAMDLLEIDENGLNEKMRLYLKYIAESEKGAMGLETLSKKLFMDKKSVVDTVENVLLRKNFVEVEPRGRKITAKGMMIALECGDMKERMVRI